MGKIWKKVEQDIEGFKRLVAESRSVEQVAKALGYKEEAGGTHQHLLKKFKFYGIDVSHFQGQGWGKGKNKDSDPAYGKISRLRESPWEQVFRKNSKYCWGHGLKKKLLEAGKKKNQCEECGLGDLWRGKTIALQIDHKDGDRRNNEEANLRFLCPNCHSQTETFSGRKLRGRKYS